MWIIADPPWHKDAVGGRLHHQRHLHPPALLELAWLYKHGDDGVPKDYAKFKDLLATAALLGNERAKQDLATYLEFDLGYSGLAERFPKDEDGP